MKQDYTDIVMVLDRSGSMASVAADTIGGFNTFLEDQQKAPGGATLTLTQFDTEYEIIHTAKPIKEVPALTSSTFVPRGGTALLDAIGRTIIAAGKRLADLPEDQRPAHVLFVILTDGEENSSKEFTRDKVFEQIKHQREAYQWEFVFIGANQDAIKTSGSIGILAANSINYAANARGTKSVFQATSSNILRARAGGNASYSAGDRDEQTKAGATH